MASAARRAACVPLAPRRASKTFNGVQKRTYPRANDAHKVYLGQTVHPSRSQAAAEAAKAMLCSTEVTSSSSSSLSIAA